MFATYLKGRMKEPIRIYFFTGPADKSKPENTACTYCSVMEGILDDLKEMSPLIEIEKVEYREDHPLVLEYKIPRIPALVILDPDGKDRGIRFFGVTSVQEFTPLIEDIAQLSGRDEKLYWEITERIHDLPAPVHIRVFVTVQCPYCPDMVRLSHQLAIVHPLITAEMIEVGEFQEVAKKFNVTTVPMVMFNDRFGFKRGGITDEIFAAFVAKAAGKEVSEDDQRRMGKLLVPVEIEE